MPDMAGMMEARTAEGKSSANCTIESNRSDFEALLRRALMISPSKPDRKVLFRIKKSSFLF